MANLGKIHVGDLKTDIYIQFQDTDVNDVNSNLDTTGTSDADHKITIFDPDGNALGPFTMTKLNNTGLAHYVTNDTTSIWTKAGMWNWHASIVLTSGKFTTNHASREVI